MLLGVCRCRSAGCTAVSGPSRRHEAKAVVVLAEAAYSDAHRDCLRRLIDEGIELFCVQGADCAGWEAEMARLCIALDASGEVPGAFCLTTCHPDENADEVIAFARDWFCGHDGPWSVAVIRIGVDGDG